MTILPKSVDVLVIGAGNAALCAAITARRAGARVLILESAPKDFRGGNSRHTRNIRYAHSAANDYVTGAYTVEEYWDDLLRVTAGNTNEDLAKMVLRESEDLFDWMQDQGIRFQPPLSGTLACIKYVLISVIFMGFSSRLLLCSLQQRTHVADGIGRGSAVSGAGDEVG